MFVSFCRILGVLMLVIVPVSAQAADVSPADRAALIARIGELQAEVSRLTTLLGQRLAGNARVPYQARLFARPVEATYAVDNGVLVPFGSENIRPQDNALFGVFVSTIGREAVARRVVEWRVFADMDGEVDAYVEQITGTDRFVVNINRIGFDLKDGSDLDALRELFIHEYVHLIFLPQPAVSAEYERRFWSWSDREASQKGRAEQQRYFRQNQDAFVSEYALQSVDEDMAEVFLFAVASPESLAVGELQEKYVFLRAVPGAGKEIDRLRSRLN